MTASIDETSKLLEAISSLIGAIAWPALALLVVWWFRHPIRAGLIDVGAAIREGRATVRAGPAGVEISTVAHAAALIGGAEVGKSETI